MLRSRTGREIIALLGGGLIGLVLIALALTPAGAQLETTFPGGSADDSLATRVTGARLRHVVVDGVPIVVVDSVRIDHRATTITGRVGRYDRQNQRAVVDGDVRIVDGPTTITGDHGTFDVGSGVGTLVGRVVVRREDLTIRAPHATYDRSSRIARLRGGVQIQDKERRVDADSLVYWFAEDRAMAFGNVRIDQTGKEEAVLRGEVAEYLRSTGDLRLLEQASLVIEDEGQPVTVTARDLQYQKEGAEVVAEGSVVIRQEEAEATADHATFFRDDRRAVLTGSPLMRDPDGLVSGDSLVLSFDQGKLSQLGALGQARANYSRELKTGGKEELHISADRLDIEFEDGEARQMSLAGNAESLYLPAGEPLESGAIRNVAKADRIQVSLSKGQAERIVLEGDATGEYFYRLERPDSLGEVNALGRSDSRLAGVLGDSARAFADSARSGLRRILAEMDSARAVEGEALGAAADSAFAEADSAFAEADSAFAGAEMALAAAADSTAVLAPISLAAALPDSIVQSVRYQADRIELLVERNEILLIHNAELFHEDLHLKAGRVRFSVEDRTLVASESPVLADGSQTMEGEAMAYEFGSREGAVRQGETTFERGIYTGRELYKAGDRVFYVKGANYTTCTIAEPHYHFTGNEMKVYLDDKVVTRPVGLFIRSVPILALPYYIFPIKAGRHSGILMPQVEFGFSQTRGRFVRNAGYYYVINDYADTKIWGDFSEYSPHVIGNVDFRYAKRYLMNGNFASKFSFGGGQERWDVRGSHGQDLGQRRTLQANIDFLSDREFRVNDQGQTDEERFSSQLRSNVTFAKSWSTQSARVTLERTQNLQNLSGQTQPGKGTVTGSLPSLSYSFQSRPIGRRPDAKGRDGRWPALATTNYSFSGDYRRGFDSRRAPSAYLQTASGRATVSDGRRAGVLNLTPSFSVNTSWDEYLELAPDTAGVIRRGDEDVFRGQYSAGLTTRTEIYGMLSPALGPFKGFRHIVTPTASLSFAKRFDSRSLVSTGPASSSLNFGVSNRIETRLPGDKGKLRVVRDFLTFNLASTYDLSNRSARRLTPIRLDARLRPGVGRDIEVAYATTYDPYAMRPTRYDISGRFTFVRAGGTVSTARPGEVPPGQLRGDDMLGLGDDGQPEGGAVVDSGDVGGRSDAALGAAVSPAELFPRAFSAGGTISYAGGGGGDKTLQASFDTTFRPTPKWRLEYRLRYDLMDRDVIAQSYAVVRDLHCWEAQFRRTYDVGNWEYYFRIAIKDLPEIFYERGRERSNLPSLIR